jgi:uncharacterized membrane protein
MLTPARIAGHPIHPMLVTIPIGLWLFSFACDVAQVLGAAGSGWQTTAYYTLLGGLVGAGLAAVPGVVDMLSLPRRIERVALIHMALNVVVMVLYAVNAWLRSRGMLESGMWLSALGVAVLAVSGWLGGKLVYEHGVGIDTEALRATVPSPQSASAGHETKEPAPRVATSRRA